MDAMLWLLLPLFVAAGSALMAYFLMQSKLEVAVAKERETLAEARAVISTHQRTMEETIRATEEASKRQALDEFLADFRVEERHYVRESKSLFMNRKSMVLQERLFFRNIPLSNWVEHEMVIEDGGDIQKLAKACSVFGSRNSASDMAAAALGGASAGFLGGGAKRVGKMNDRMGEREAAGKLLPMEATGREAAVREASVREPLVRRREIAS